MEQTYVDIMLQSLNKKLQVLDEIEVANIVQRQLLEDERSDADEFDKTVEDKARLIQQMEKLDSGFDKLYDRVKEELHSNKEAYSDQIRSMQQLIRQITDKSMVLQAQEARNKDLMTRKFAYVKDSAKAVRTNTKAANQYYRNMMQLNYVDPQFLDNKK